MHHIIYLHKNDINELLKQSKSSLFVSQLVSSHIMFKMSTFRHHTSLMLIVPLTTLSPRFATTMFAACT